MKNKFWKAFLSGFLNPFGYPTYQDMISLPHGEITRRINEKIAKRRAESDMIIKSAMRKMRKAKKKS